MTEGEMFIITAHKIWYPSRRSFLNICLNFLRDITFLSSLGILFQIWAPENETVCFPRFVLIYQTNIIVSFTSSFSSQNNLWSYEVIYY